VLFQPGARFFDRAAIGDAVKFHGDNSCSKQAFYQPATGVLRFIR
jgi:hypothetical protein